jgi:hypothetical protein
MNRSLSLALLCLASCARQAPRAPDPVQADVETIAFSVTVDWMIRLDSLDGPFVLRAWSDSRWMRDSGSSLAIAIEDRSERFVPGLVTANSARRRLPCEALPQLRRTIVCLPETYFSPDGDLDWLRARTTVPGLTKVWLFSRPAFDPRGFRVLTVIQPICAPDAPQRCEDPWTLELAWFNARWEAYRIQHLPPDPDFDPVGGTPAY